MDAISDAWDATLGWSSWNSIRQWLTLLLLFVTALGALWAAKRTADAAAASSRSADAAATLARAAMSEHAPQLSIEADEASGFTEVALHNHGLGPSLNTKLIAELTLHGSYAASAIESAAPFTLPAGGLPLGMTVDTPRGWAARQRQGDPDDPSSDLFSVYAQITLSDGSVMSLSITGVLVLAEPPKYTLTLTASGESIFPEGEPSTNEGVWSGSLPTQPPRSADFESAPSR